MVFRSEVVCQGKLYREAIRDTNCAVIKTFRHKGPEAFFRGGTKAGIQPAHADKLRRLLARLDHAAHSKDMDVPGWKLHAL